MTRLMFALAALLGIASMQGLAVNAAHAQGYYRDDDDYRPRRRDDDDRYRERRYEGDRCRDTIRSTGVGYPFIGISRNSAIKAWRREAQAVYGRDFNWSLARNKFITCEPYLAVQRCTASGRPCG